MNKINNAISLLIGWISLPVWIIASILRNKTVLRLLSWFIVISAFIIRLAGLDTYLQGLAMVGQFAFAAVFMIAQFAFLFMFLSSSKGIETVPGDEGLVNFQDDYYGNDYLVESVRQWVALMTDEGRAKMEAIGAEAINGILLEGPPGTGKTLLARCLATDSSAAFIGLSGTDFQAMFIGVGPMKVMRTYSKAKSYAKRYGAVIVFIDEIDAIGGNRGAVSGDARRSPVAGGMGGGMFGGGGLGVLSKLLTELDGSKDVHLRDQIQNRIRSWFNIEPIDPGIILTMGATNRFEALDPALIRPGRIDKRIRVDPPDKASRKQIIEGYLRKVRHDETVDVERLVHDTQGVTPADIASAVQRGAARHAIYDERDSIGMSDIEKALQEDLVGLANPIADFQPEQKLQVASHEAGHALAAFLFRPEKRITNVSIIRRSGILGYVRDVDTTEVYSIPLERYAANIQVSLAGHLASEIVMGKPWSGATGDFRNVTNMMYAMAQLGEFAGQIPYEIDDPFSNKDIKKAGDRYLKQARIATKAALLANREKLDEIIEALMEKDELNSEEIYAILGEPNE